MCTYEGVVGMPCFDIDKGNGCYSNQGGLFVCVRVRGGLGAASVLRKQTQ